MNRLKNSRQITARVSSSSLDPSRRWRAPWPAAARAWPQRERRAARHLKAFAASPTPLDREPGPPGLAHWWGRQQQPALCCKPHGSRGGSAPREDTQDGLMMLSLKLMVVQSMSLTTLPAWDIGLIVTEPQRETRCSMHWAQLKHMLCALFYLFWETNVVFSHMALFMMLYSFIILKIFISINFVLKID